MDGRGNLGRRSRALHAHRTNDNLEAAGAPPQNIEHVTNGCAAWGSDNSDAPRKFGQRFLARGIEQTFRFQVAFEGLESRL